MRHDPHDAAYDLLRGPRDDRPIKVQLDEAVKEIAESSADLAGCIEHHERTREAKRHADSAENSASCAVANARSRLETAQKKMSRLAAPR